MEGAKIELINRIKEFINYTDEELDLFVYSYSAHTCYTKKLRKPLVVVMPRSTEEVQKVVRIANELKIPVIPYGVGSGSAQGSEPVDGAIVVDMRQMNKIIEIDTEAMTVTAQAGATLWQIDRELNKYNLTLGDNSQSRIVATIGGRISTAGLPNDTLGYGAAEDQFLALTVVLPTGEVAKVGSKNRKSSSGYNLIKLFVAAEGTLGIITEATLKAYEIPECHRAAAVGFKKIEDFISSLRRLFKAFIRPSQMMVYDSYYWRFIGFECENLEWIATFSFKGDRDVVEFLMNKSVKILSQKGTELPIEVAEKFKKSIYEYNKNIAILSPMKKRGKSYAVIDFTVPLHKLEKLRNYIYEKANTYNFEVIGSYFHVTDISCGIAYKAMVMRELDDEMDEKRYQEFLKEVAIKTLSLGGTLSSFRGVGKYLADYFHLEHRDALPLLIKIKKALDPNLIMNPNTKLKKEVIENGRD
ncbi:MAG: FAD-binding oxidoreductase [Archaeoglobaceae archaeon]